MPRHAFHQSSFEFSLSNPAVIRAIEAREQGAAVRAVDRTGRWQVLPFAAEDVMSSLINSRMVSVAAMPTNGDGEAWDRKNEVPCSERFIRCPAPRIIQTQLVQATFAPASTVHCRNGQIKIRFHMLHRSRDDDDMLLYLPWTEALLKLGCAIRRICTIT